ncbi:MAG: hypothetical protein R3C20_24235 [Planctomycetaceae bacterium]
MLRGLLLILAAVSISAPVRAQVSPSCIAPQWQWGQTGNIYHYYSEYIYLSDSPPFEQLCYLSYWDNYDSTDGNLPFCYCDGGDGCPSCSVFSSLVSQETNDASRPDERLRLLGTQNVNDTGCPAGLPPNVEITLANNTEIRNDQGIKVGEGTAKILNERLCSTNLNGQTIYFKLFEVQLTVQSMAPVVKDHSTVVRLGFQTETPDEDSLVHRVDSSLFEVLMTDRIAGQRSKCALVKLSTTRTFVVRLAS